MTIFAMVFPGQGSQTVGMLAELSSEYTIVKATFSEASAVLGYDLWQRVQEGPAEELNKTWQTQPALLASSVAIWRVWQQRGGRTPAFLAGHSLGEYSALVCASSLVFTDAIELVALRGTLMQEAAPEGRGAMTAIIGLDHAAITTACQQAAQGQVVSLLDFNAPGQVVISGHKEAVERAGLFCKETGAKRVLPLPISVPAHCILMRPAAEKLAQALSQVTFITPRIPVINNVDARVEQDPSAIRQALVRQLYSPVRWTQTVEYLATQGVETLLEIGPGKVLTGLTKRILATMSGIAVNDLTSLAATIKY
ncbi:ACP S-malonyltransferase [secondary endosymbiont of Ctenarytaina eucalypti]|uniref:Malonyl CoA-acyl carrier protein transacylase n=1 Tax=secondary endosymbiont of Ctenarytaina eucalypti TaxID=1199245 RepID=J3VTA5_9ENTR|nr:ACP S-malonyltransferase [secondary endosymbiont of Ctenarytaina eucalypti]AFP85196.1 malonyl CoA-acyl carrier protein transacylase [secondary endosymbiont of Ctenarytaina eucalypti]